MNDTQSFFSLGYVRALLVLALVGVIAALTAYAHLAVKQARYSNFGPTTINVRGEGEVFAKPDIGQFSFSVMAEGDTAAEAQEKSATAMNAILEYLGGAGVEEKDIKTEGYYLNPKYVYEDRICMAGSYCPPGNPVADGYEVNQSVTVKVRDLNKSGELISGVGDKGATNISSLQFTIDDETNLKAEAREAAIADAKEKAEKLADALDVRIVRMIGYYEDEGMYPMYGYGGEMMAKDAAVNAVPSMPVGENSIMSNVNITYEIR